MNQTSSATATDQLSDDERNSIFGLLKILVDHLNCNGINVGPSNGDGSSGKLVKLNIRHLIELASDMCDEINRRSLGANSPLPCKPESTSKRNNARAKMSEFPCEKMNNLILEVVQELENRNFSPSSEISSSDIKKRNRASIQEPILIESSSATSNDSAGLNLSAKKKKAMDDKVVKNSSVTSSSSLTGIDSLNAIINELGSFIDNDDSEEIALLKQRYEDEIQQLKQSLGKFESIIVPEKTREIVSLMSKVEEMNLLNARLRNELSSLNNRLCDQDVAIKNQKQAYDSLKECIDNLLVQLSSRTSDSRSSRTSARIELISSNVLSDFNMYHDQILSALAGLNESISNYNPKQCLSLLRMIANTAKASVLGFDKILQMCQGLNLDALCDEGEILKSSYISALSSALVSGKDFTIRHNSSDFSNSLSNFRSVQESLHNLKHKFENELQSE